MFKDFTDVVFLSIKHNIKKIKNMRHFFLTASHTMCLPMIIAGTAMPATRPIPTGAPTNVPSCQRIFFFRDHGFLPQNVQPDGLQEEKCTFERHVMVPVAQLVEALCYNAEGCGFDSWRCHWHKPSGCTMALRLIQPLAKISTRNMGGRQRPVHRADTLTTFMCLLSRYLEDSTFWNTQGLKQACTRTALFFYIFLIW